MLLTWEILAAKINAMPASQQTLPVTCYHSGFDNDYEAEYQNVNILLDNGTGETETGDIKTPVAYLMLAECQP